MGRQSSQFLKRVLLYELSVSLVTCDPGNTEYLRLSLSQWKVQVTPPLLWAAPQAGGTGGRDGRAEREREGGTGTRAERVGLAGRTGGQDDQAAQAGRAEVKVACCGWLPLQRLPYIPTSQHAECYTFLLAAFLACKTLTL